MESLLRGSYNKPNEGFLSCHYAIVSHTTPFLQNTEINQEVLIDTGELQTFKETLTRF
jgi:hypothetical protein